MNQTNKEKKAQLMNGYLNEMRKKYAEDGEMLEYFRKTAGQIVQLTNGGFFVVPKSVIQTSFCFGYRTDYSGEECANAESSRRTFLSSTQYFKAENLRGLDDKITALKDIESEPLNLCGYDTFPILRRVSYYGESEPLNVYKYETLDYWTFKKEFDLDAISPADIEKYCIGAEDLAIIIQAYEAERNAFNKRLDTYIKKYGTSKLKTWKYWIDE